LPVQIRGLEYSAYSRLPGKSLFNLLPKVSMEILPAQELKTDKNATFHDARRQSSNRLYEILAAMRLDACDLNQTLLEAVIKSMHRVGRNKQMMEDTDRKPLKFKQIFLRSFILGRLINKALPEEHTIGIMLPTSNACVLTLLGVQAYGNVPAMLNFSSGPKQVISTCHTAQIKKVITARKVVTLAKLDALIDALTKEGIEVVYLEDLKKLLTKKDILAALFGSFFPMSFYHKHAGYVRPSDPAVILFTSGSEGLPKGVLLSHSNVLGNAFQVSTMFDVWDNDVMLNCLPIFHSFGLSVGTFVPLVFGFKLVSYPTPLHYRAIPEFCSSVRATIFFSTDTFLSGYAKCANPYDFNSLRIVGAGAEALKEETRRIWTEKFGVRVFEGYGATECSPIISVNTFLRSRAGSVGCLLTGLEYKLREVPGIKDGKELIVKGPNVMSGYMKHDNPGVLQPPKDGWYETGDIVDVDKDGFVFIKGRSKRFAKIAGEMVSLLAVETAIAKQFKGFIHGVVSISDPKKGEQLVLITTCGDVSAEKLITLFQEAGLPELAIPKKIIFTDNPPLFSTGKFDYPTGTELAKKEINK
ncbi:MAG: AMP-binding protein, partial [Alphaproteobacteria bacterium]